MGHVTEQSPGIADDLVVPLSLDMDDETDPAGVPLLFRVVQSLSCREGRVGGVVVLEVGLHANRGSLLVLERRGVVCRIGACPGVVVVQHGG